MIHEILSNKEVIDRKIDARAGEIPEILKKFKRETLLIDTEKGRVIANLCSERNKIKNLFSISPETLLHAIENPREARIKSGGKVKENIIKQDSINLNNIPISKYYTCDAGKYITTGVVVTKDPEYGRNISFHRMLVLGKDKLTARLVENRDTHTYYNRAIERGEELEIAICIGLHPAVLFAAATSVSIERDELEIASALMNGNLNLIKCETVDLEVPDAEFVLEGKITKETAPEGPFVDITGTYDFVRHQPIIKLNSIMHRNDPVYHSLLPASHEHLILMGMPRESTILREAGKVCDVTDLCLTKGGSGWLHCVISINKKFNDDAKKAINAAFSGHKSLKHVVVVDNDINIHNPKEVEWAIATRFQADKDMVVIKGAKGSSLDPSSYGGLTAKVGVDATKPIGGEGFDRVSD
ncbi:hypothetical protein BEH94_04355 [Candidatus Altiarchaeales archaeon WOR_SM1_SCG]|nr:hypothetical protein BEH94_04355 [Candidatus Altiarchaeales archaeon WOR_SM1_SCG]